MIERVHEHIVAELQQNARTDIVFIIAAIFLNLVSLAVNSGVATSGGEDATMWIVLAMFAVLVIVVNFVCEIGLIKGRQTRMILLEGLMKMYKDKGVDGYYDSSLLSNYNTRYNLFILAVLVTGLIALIIPLVVIMT
jgi:hypothetical protein